MSGRFDFHEATDLQKHAHLNFFTSDDGSNMVLSFIDYRRFGKWLPGHGFSLDERGPCVLQESQQFRENVLDNLDNNVFNKPICEVLLNQKYFNGIGNYLRAEVLYRAKIAPFVCARSVLEPLTKAACPVKSEEPDILQLCSILPNEVIQLDELGDRLADIVEPQEEEQTTWRGQFVSAMQVGGGTDDDGNDVPASAIHYVLHFLTFFWKILGACVPPTKYLGAWPTFWLSLLYIGLLVLVVEQLGHLIGCFVGLPISVTGITIIALGTSLPDTFASRTAAQQDEYADAAIGNVTGSNCVNVFLGLGIPWVLSAMYHLAKGTEFKVQSDNLTQSVIIFSSVGALCIIILLIQRKLVGGELGGKNAIVRWGSSLLLFLLWVLYIVLVSLKATDKLKWEI